MRNESLDGYGGAFLGTWNDPRMNANYQARDDEKARLTDDQRRKQHESNTGIGNRKREAQP